MSNETQKKQLTYPNYGKNPEKSAIKFEGTTKKSLKFGNPAENTINEVSVENLTYTIPKDKSGNVKSANYPFKPYKDVPNNPQTAIDISNQGLAKLYSLNILKKISNQKSNFNIMWPELEQITNNKTIKDKLKEIKEVIDKQFDFMTQNIANLEAIGVDSFSSTSPLKTDLDLFKSQMELTFKIQEYELIKTVFKSLNYFYRSTFYDELVRINQPKEQAEEIVRARTFFRNNIANTDELIKSTSKVAYRQICFNYGTKQDLENTQIETGINIDDIKPYKQDIKTTFINLLAGLLDNYPIDIDIQNTINMTKDIFSARVMDKTKKRQKYDYIYGYTVKLQMTYGTLDKYCKLAIPDGGFDEIGKQMKNTARIKQIREERSICKHGDTVAASFSKWFKGGRRKTRKLNKNKLKKTKRHKRKTNRRIPKRQRKTHKRR
jgi:hypothetical protein